MTFWPNTPVCFLVSSADGQPFHVDIPHSCLVVCARAVARRFPCGSGSGRAARAEPAVVTRTRTRTRISHDLPFIHVVLTRTMALSDTSVRYALLTSISSSLRPSTKKRCYFLVYTLVFVTARDYVAPKRSHSSCHVETLTDRVAPAQVFHLGISPAGLPGRSTRVGWRRRRERGPVVQCDGGRRPSRLPRPDQHHIRGIQPV